MQWQKDTYKFFLLHLRARKSNNYCYCDSIRERNRENKQRTDTNTKNEEKNIKSNNFTGSNREKSNIAIAVLETKQLDSNIIISHFWCTNKYSVTVY